MRMKPKLESADAAAIIAAAKAEAAKNGWPVTIAVVDDGGHLIALERMDGAPVTTVAIATEKARTAAFFAMPSKWMQDMLKEHPEMGHAPGILPLQGGVPVMAGKDCVGGAGASGVQAHEDEQVALAGAAAVKR